MSDDAKTKMIGFGTLVFGAVVTLVSPFLFVVLLLGGCANTLTVDRDVYVGNAQWFGSTRQLSKGQILRARSEARKGNMAACESIAVQALAFDVLIPHRVAMTLWASSPAQGPDPGPRPPIPLPGPWCAAARTSSITGSDLIVSPSDDPNHPARIP